MCDESKITVLFVDDDRNILSGLRRMLRPQRGRWNMLFANGGPDALDVLKDNSIDIVVTDMRMPELDGAQLLDIVASQSPELVRLVLSGQAHKKKLLQIVGTAHRFLTKPCDTDVLIQTIEDALGLLQSIDDPGIRKAVSQARTLRSDADLLGKLGSAWATADTTGQNIYSLVSRDVGVATKMLQLVSSSFLGAGKPIDTLEAAHQQLGNDLLQELDKSSNAFIAIESGPDAGFSRCLKTINQQSIAVAELAKKIAVGMSEQDGRRAYIAGLLHNAGKVLMLQSWPDEYVGLISSTQDVHELLSLEESKFGTNHAEIGSYLLQLWGIHEDIVFTAKNYFRAEAMVGNSMSVSEAVHVAAMALAKTNDKQELKIVLQESDYVKRAGCVSAIDQWIEFSPPPLSL